MKTFKSQRRLASQVLGVGKNRVWFDQLRLNDIQEALTRSDIEELIKDNAIKSKSVHKKKSRVKRKREGTAHIKKKIKMRKRNYIINIRKLRKYLKNLKTSKNISREEYISLRKKAKAGQFKSLRYLREYVSLIKTNPVLGQESSKKKKKIRRKNKWQD